MCFRYKPQITRGSHIDSYTVLQRVAGKDASKQFWKYHNEGILKKYKGQLQIGSLDTKKTAEPASAPAQQAAPVRVSDAQSATGEALEPYGELIPFADPAWYQGVSGDVPSRYPISCI